MGYRFDRFSSVGTNEEATMGHHPNSLRALRDHGPKKGDAPRNRIVDLKTGQVHYANGWTKLREKFRERLDQDLDVLTDKLIELAKEGDVQALRLAMGPVLNVRALELAGSDGTPIDFAGLARKALANK
jgi:hypothetical protein